MNKLFNRTGGARPGRSVFNLSHEKKFDCDAGQLIPIMCDEAVPGDIFKIGVECVIRAQPLVAPILHRMDAVFHYFFVPYRLMSDDWEDFITGGPGGTEEDDGLSAAVCPYWEPTNTAIGSLWDYLGFPTGVDPDGAYPLDFPRIAYNFIWNEFYRGQDLQAEVALTNESILNCGWEKDYFTSALPWQQRGTAPALPVSGLTSAVFPNTNFEASASSGPSPWFSATTGNKKANISNADPDHLANLKAFFNDNSVDLSNATTFDVSDLRLAFQIQKWMERNARAGVRYTEFIGAHFGSDVAPRDERLQRPEYLGGTKLPIIVSEVLQTSSTDVTSPQGNLAGHGIGVSSDFVASYKVREFGLIMGIMSIRPKPLYQQGIDRQWLRRTRYDFFFPEFANLSEQAIERAEIFASGVPAENTTIFGYQGRYDEMRVKHSKVCGNLRDSLDYWHMSRQFAAAPELNDDFVKMVPTKRIFAAENEPGWIVSVGNVIKAIRPLPIMAEPGLIDH